MKISNKKEEIERGNKMKRSSIIIILIVIILGGSIFYCSQNQPNAQEAMQLAEEAKTLVLDLKEDGYSIERVEKIVAKSYSKIDVFKNPYEDEIIIASKQSNGERNILFRIDFE